MQARAADPQNAVLDRFWQGRLQVWQPARQRGYRFTLDAVLLAAFAPPGAHVLDLGAGCGIVGLLLLASGKAQRLTAVERQPQLAELCRRNACANGFAERMEVIEADLRDPAALPAQAYDAAVFNPPYYPAEAARHCPEPGRDQARNERHGTLVDFARAAGRAVRAGGEVAAIAHQERGEALHACLTQSGIWPTRRRLTRARPDPLSAVHHALLGGRVVSAQPPTTCVQLADLVIHGPSGRAFSPEVQIWLDGPAP